MKEKMLFWETGDKGVIIDPDEVFDAVETFEFDFIYWAEKYREIEFNKDDIKDMGKDEIEEYLNELVGKECQRVHEDYTSSEDLLCFDMDEKCFFNLEDVETIKAYGYFCNTNWTVVTLGESSTEYNFEILDTYNLDYLKPNSTNWEYGGMGEHAKLQKVKEGDQEYLLMHEWSQWQGSELDTGYLLTADETVEALSGLYNTDGEYWDIKPHPELEEIKEWLGVKNDEEENTENK